LLASELVETKQLIIGETCGVAEMSAPSDVHMEARRRSDGSLEIQGLGSPAR
jgi:hypothetical protein